LNRVVCGVSGLDRGKECIQRCSLPWFGVCWFRVSFCFNEDSGGMGRSGPAVQCARRKKLVRERLESLGTSIYEPT